jgi:hypothetical protein
VENPTAVAVEPSDHMDQEDSVDQPTYVQYVQDILVHCLWLLAVVLTTLCEGPHPGIQHIFFIKTKKKRTLTAKDHRHKETKMNDYIPLT